MKKKELVLSAKLQPDLPLDRSCKNYQYSTEGQKCHQNLAPVLVISSGNSLAFPTKIITSTVFYWYCVPDAPAPIVVKNQSHIRSKDRRLLPTSASQRFSEEEHWKTMVRGLIPDRA